MPSKTRNLFLAIGAIGTSYAYDHYRSHVLPVQTNILLNNCGWSTKYLVCGLHPIVRNSKTIWNYLYPATPATIKLLTYSPICPHQWSINMRKYSTLITKALTSAPLPSFNDFEDIMVYVTNQLKGVVNYGLITYDIALRIGYNLTPQILPQKYVYLFAGALRGSYNLYSKSQITAQIKKNRNGILTNRVSKSFFNKKFPSCPAWEIEDMLCIYY